jgi:hypothetical protein
MYRVFTLAEQFHMSFPFSLHMIYTVAAEWPIHTCTGVAA